MRNHRCSTMIDKATARQLASAAINTPDSTAFEQLEMLILDDYTRDEDFGWVFFFDSKLHHETGDWQYMLAGNGPIIVNRTTGEVSRCGSAHDPEYYISEYRQQIAPGSDQWVLEIL